MTNLKKRRLNYLWASCCILFAGMLTISPAAAQNARTVTGAVTDETNSPIVGAMVIQTGTNNVTITDGSGNYSIGLPAGDVTLDFQLTGYVSQQVAVGTRSVVNVTLAADAQQIEELVVVGYGTQKKATLTSAIGTASGEVLENRPITTIGEGLQGVIPNLQITPGGTAPGQGASFNIRGYTSLNGGSPLVLVDGVVQDPNLVNPNDIESVSVLMDAASSAIYGSRAAYGVILFTTKGGKKNTKPVFNVSSSWSVSAPIHLQHTMNSLDYMNLINLGLTNSGSPALFDKERIDHVKAYMADPENVLPMYYDPDRHIDGKYIYAGNTDWADELYKNGAQQQYNVSMSGGSENSRYYVSYGLLDQKGVLAAYNDRYQRHTVSSDLTTDIQKWLTLGAKVKYTYGYEDHPSGGMSQSGLSATGGVLKSDLPPTMPVRHPDGSYAGQGNITNPFAIGDLAGYSHSKVNDLWVTGKMTLRPLTDWNINADFTFNPYSKNDERVIKQFKERRADGSEYVYPWVRDDGVFRNNANDYYTALNVYTDYTANVGRHNFKLTFGYNHEVKTNKSFSASRLGMIDMNTPMMSLATGTQTVGDSATSWAVQGVFGRFHYDFDERYLIDVNARYDGSSKFAEGKRFAMYPSVSAAWYISNENFMEGSKHWLSDLKLRASCGSLGNQAVNSNFPYVPAYGINRDHAYLIGGSRGVAITAPGLVSGNLTWETVTSWNVGVDFGFFDNKLTGLVNIFERHTNDMLVPSAPLPGVLGVTAPQANAANLKTTGWELSLAWQDRVESIGLDYHASFVLSDAVATITKYDNPTKSLSSPHYVGKKIGEIWGYESNGLYQSDEEIVNGPDLSKIYGGTWYSGDVRYEDRDNDGEVSIGSNTVDDPGDRFIIGNNTSRYQYGITLGAAWKGFDLEMFLQGVAKRDIWDGSSRYFGTGNEWDVPARDIESWWTKENPDGFLPRPYMELGGPEAAHGNRQASTRYLQNAAYLRLKQLSLGYTIPQSLTRKIMLDKVRIYFTGQNLLTFTKLSKLYDPEIIGNANQISGSVASNMTYPIAKTFSFGLNLTF